MAWTFRNPGLKGYAYLWAILSIGLVAVGAYLVIAKLFLGAPGPGAVGTVDGVDRELGQNPLYEAIAKADPAAYQEIRGIIEHAVLQGRTEPEIEAEVMPTVGRVAKRYLPVASGDAILQVARIAALEIDEIGAKSADACFDFLYPRPGTPPVVVSRFATPEVLKDDTAATTAMLQSALSSPQRVPGKEEVAPALGQVARELIATYGAAEVGELAHPAAMDHAKACLMTSALYKDVLALPAAEAVPLLRFLFSQKAAT